MTKITQVYNRQQTACHLKYRKSHIYWVPWKDSPITFDNSNCIEEVG